MKQAQFAKLGRTVQYVQSLETAHREAYLQQESINTPEGP